MKQKSLIRTLRKDGELITDQDQAIVRDTYDTSVCVRVVMPLLERAVKHVLHSGRKSTVNKLGAFFSWAKQEPLCTSIVTSKFDVELK